MGDVLMAPRLVLEYPPNLTTCRRLDVVENLAAWIERSGPIGGLPDGEIIIEVSASALLPRSLFAGHQPPAVGTFLVRVGAQYPDAFRVLVAIGDEVGDDDTAWLDRLATVPHELVHVAQFASTFGARSPGAVARAAVDAKMSLDEAFASWFRLDHEGGGETSPEAIGRRAMWAFLRDHPEYVRPPVCPPACAHRPR